MCLNSGLLQDAPLRSGVEIKDLVPKPAINQEGRTVMQLCVRSQQLRMVLVKRLRGLIYFDPKQLTQAIEKRVTTLSSQPKNATCVQCKKVCLFSLFSAHS